MAGSSDTGTSSRRTMDMGSEWVLVAQLKASVETQDASAKETDNFTLRRFLRARDWDVDRAASLFLRYLKWRREAVIGGFVSESEIRNELSHQKVYMQGFDKLGRPILVLLAAKHTSVKRQMDELKRFVIYFLDKACTRIPNGQEKFIAIIDFKGWSYSDHCDVRAYTTGLDIMQSYFPERLAKALLINVPYVFMKAWKLVYPFIDKNTREKFIFVDDKKLQRTLREEIDESQLPEIHGGKLALIPIDQA